jgi:hypothetical protein
MKLLAPILAASIGAFVLFSCAPFPPPPAAVPSACNAAGSALNPVAFVRYGFAPQSNTTPQLDSAPVQPDIQSDLNAAFAAASPGFRQQLCGLNGIFIDPTGCKPPDASSPYYNPATCDASAAAIAKNSWGMRQYGGNGTILGRYVGLSLGLWNNSGGWRCPGSQTLCAPPFQAYETAVLQASLSTLARINRADLPTVSSVSFGSSDYNPSAMTVLANLGHENGHILWYDTFVPRGGGDASIPAPTPSCPQPFYNRNNWPHSLEAPPHRWLTFAQIRDQPVNSTVLRLQRLYSIKNFDRAAGDVYQLYSGKQWASALATFSPDEDFVETFELSVLVSASPPLTSMQITVPGYAPYDIFNNLVPGTELARKFACVRASSPPSPQPLPPPQPGIPQLQPAIPQTPR